MTYAEEKCHITAEIVGRSNSRVKQLQGVLIILNISNVPHLEVVCFTTTRLIRYVLTTTDRPSTPF